MEECNGKIMNEVVKNVKKEKGCGNVGSKE